MLHSGVDSVFPAIWTFTILSHLCLCAGVHISQIPTTSLAVLKYSFNFGVFEVGFSNSAWFSFLRIHSSCRCQIENGQWLFQVSRAPRLVSKDDKGKKVYQPTVFQMGFQRTDVALMSIDLSSFWLRPPRHCMICAKKGQPYQVWNTSKNWNVHEISTMMTRLLCHLSSLFTVYHACSSA